MGIVSMLPDGLDQAWHCHHRDLGKKRPSILSQRREWDQITELVCLCVLNKKVVVGHKPLRFSVLDKREPARGHPQRGNWDVPTPLIPYGARSGGPGVNPFKAAV